MLCCWALNVYLSPHPSQGHMSTLTSLSEWFQGRMTLFGPHFLWPPVRRPCLFIGPSPCGEALVILSTCISRPLNPDALTVVSSVVLVQGVHLPALRDGMGREQRGYGWSTHSQLLQLWVADPGMKQQTGIQVPRKGLWVLCMIIASLWLPEGVLWVSVLCTAKCRGWMARSPLRFYFSTC